MTTSIPFRQGLFVPVIFCGLLAAFTFQTSSHAEPRVPLPTLPISAMETYHNRFDDAYWNGKQRTETVLTEEGTLVESFSGYALQRAGKEVRPFVLPAVSELGHVQVSCGDGAIGFWFKPYWSSAAVKSGSLLGVPARLLDLVVIGARDAVVGWSLQVSADGNALMLMSADGATTLLRADIAWSGDEWHWVVLNYGERGTALYVDEAWVAEGEPTFALPPRMAGLVWGSSVLGTETAGGEFEEIAAYRRPLTAARAGLFYGSMKKRTLMGAVSAEQVAANAKRRAEWKALAAANQPDDGSGMMMRMMTTTVTCVTNAPIYITNTACLFVTNQGWTVTFDVQGTNGPADIFMTTNLVGNNITNAAWVWLERGLSCATYQYTNQLASQSFYILGTTLDTDGDGLTDAFEKLVSKTNPNNADTDGDGWSDAEEIQNNTDPKVVDQPFRVRITRPSNNSVIP